ncbi:HD domain-containing protein [Tautonia sociabilis]|uniref:HD domain-containing protein n=1 Tax=Tautonia sociabilis TaxID=2080755 RepID=A0A432MJY1_9BACT|nr:HD domain-containing protein [Tautonia sociabilis]RUL87713.1 HD domain-containing protein [Tautonia sociabilis]
MGISYDEARRLLGEWTSSPSLLAHARAVEVVLRKAAHRYGGGEAVEERWAITGLLHDADYDRWPEEHPRRIVSWLEDHGEPEIAHAISAHFTRWGVPAESPLDRALLACDELTGFVVACCLVRPDGITSLAPSSVKKKLRDRAFAAKVDRDEVRLGVEGLGVPIEEHIQLIIDALAPHAEELGIGPKA